MIVHGAATVYGPAIAYGAALEVGPNFGQQVFRHRGGRRRIMAPIANSRSWGAAALFGSEAGRQPIMHNPKVDT